MNVTIIGTSIYYIFMQKNFGLSFVYRTFENELFKRLGSNWSFPRFTKKNITNVVTTKTWKHDQLVRIMRKTSWDMEHGRTSKLQMENANSFPISKLQDISSGTLCLFNLNLVYYLHYCPKDLKHYRTPTFKVNLTQECLGYTYFALSQLVRMCLSLRTLL